MNALVDPLPFVPAICIQFKRLKSDGCNGGHSARSRDCRPREAHLVTNPATPLKHLRYGLLIHTTTRLSDCVDDREVGLKSIERRNGILMEFSSSFTVGRAGDFTLYERPILLVDKKRRQMDVDKRVGWSHSLSMSAYFNRR